MTSFKEIKLYHYMYFLYLAELCDIPCEHGILNKKACKCDCSDYWDGPACGTSSIIITELGISLFYIHSVFVVNTSCI